MIVRERPIYVDVPDVRKDVAGLRRGRWKLVRSAGDLELYDLERDPGETRDLAASEPERTRALADELERWVADMREGASRRGTLAVPATEPHPLGHEEALRALGYVE